ncbi:MAG TPA: hypothetical protein PKO06_13660, partial [Candidatus Ozemobacteraceae bacterium]|nr:hypothetical protein [Candidatus Ozemobacteraceae bacterium]
HCHGRAAFSLIEVVLAMAILVFAFIPIMGALSSSMKGTHKDEKIVQAINLAQTSLNAALQFPFNSLPPQAGTGAGTTASPWVFGGTIQPNFNYATSTLALRLGQIGEFTVELRISDEPVRFVVPQYTAASRSTDVTANPATWNWTNYTTPWMNGIYHKYILTVSWTEPITGMKTYRLATFKARLVQ